MLKSLFKPEFTPTEGHSIKNGSYHPAGWYIGRSDRNCHGCGSFWANLDSGKAVVFARKLDCQRAIDSLAEAGIIDDAGIMKLSDDRVLELCYGNLFW